MTIRTTPTLRRTMKPVVRTTHVRTHSIMSSAWVSTWANARVNAASAA